jgi:Sec-independent protein translocase protein TatA
VWYRKEGSKTKYLGRRSIAEIKEMLAKAGAEVTYKIKAELEAAKQAVESQKPAQTSQLSQQSLTWKSGNHTYWLLLYSFKTIYVYMKGPSTKHKPRLVEKTDISGVIGRLVAAGAFHVLEALRALVNGLHAAVSDLVKPPAKPQTPAEAREESKKPQTQGRASRKEAEKTLRELKSALHRAVERWGEEWMRVAEKRGHWGEPDAEWLKEKLADFIDAYSDLLEKIQPHDDLLDKFIDAATDAMGGYLFRSDVLEILK